MVVPTRSPTRILAANAKDIDAAKKAGMSAALQDRLLLNDARVEAMARGLDDIVALPDPVVKVIWVIAVLVILLLLWRVVGSGLNLRLP